MKRPPTFIKILTVGSAALLAWTLTIQLVPRPTSLPHLQCKAQKFSSMIVQSMVDGVLTRVYQDKTTLQVEISEAWQSLDETAKKSLHASLTCFAESEEVALRISPSQESLALTNYRQ